jgi:hypothetical protein
MILKHNEQSAATGAFYPCPSFSAQKSSHISPATAHPSP